MDVDEIKETGSILMDCHCNTEGHSSVWNPDRIWELATSWGKVKYFIFPFFFPLSPLFPLLHQQSSLLHIFHRSNDGSLFDFSTLVPTIFFFVPFAAFFKTVFPFRERAQEKIHSSLSLSLSLSHLGRCFRQHRPRISTLTTNRYELYTFIQ